MYLSHAKYLLVGILFFGGATALAQTNTYSNPTNGRENNPYSKYGIGELWNGNSTILKAMGNITSAYANPYEVNTDNPASYAFLQRTTFEASATASSRFISGDGLTYKTGTATLSNLNIGIPVNNNAGLCLGFRPMTRVYYSMVDTINSGTNPTSPIGEVIDNYSGEGGLNYAFIGAARRFKGFSIGFNLGYLFGTLRHSSATIPIDTLVTNRSYSADYINYDRIGGLYWKGGIQYERKLDSDYTFRFGATACLNQGIRERVDAFQIASFNLGDTLVNDTTYNPGTKNGRLKMPLSYSIGVMICKNEKWKLGLDYTATQWNGFGSTADSGLLLGVGTSSYKISFGGSYVPNVNDLRNYFSRMTYRFGAYYGKDYLNLNGIALPVYGVTVGTSLPFKHSISALHLAFDIGRLGTQQNSLIEETYIRFTIGMSFNDRWFIPRKYD